MADSSATPAPRAFFTSPQRKLVAFALAMAAFLAIAAGLVFVFIVVSRLIGFFANVIWPLAVAGILALLLRPVVSLLERRLHLPRVASVLILYALVTLAFLGAVFLYVPALLQQIVNFINAAPELWDRISAAVNRVYPSWVELYQRLEENPVFARMVDATIAAVQQIGSSLMPNLKSAGSSVASIGAFFTNLAVIPIYLFFFLQSDEEPTRNLPEFLPFLPEETRDDVVFLAREFVAILVSFFRGQLVISLIESVLFSIGFGMAGLQLGVLIGMLCGLLNLVPYLGTAVGLLAVVPTAYFQAGGGLSLLAICLGIFVLVQILESYVLTPRIMGHQTGLHPVTILLALFFWGTALHGVLGMILAIPLTAFLVTAWRLAKRKYFLRTPPARETPGLAPG